MAPVTVIGYGVSGGVGRLLSAIPAGRAVTLVLQEANAGDDLDLTGRPDTEWIADSLFEYTGIYTPFPEVERIQVLDGLSYFPAACSGACRMGNRGLDSYRTYAAWGQVPFGGGASDGVPMCRSAS